MCDKVWSMSLPLRVVLVTFALSWMFFQFQLATKLVYSTLLVLLGGLELILAVVSGVILVVWMLRRKRWIHPATAVLWLTLGFPMFLVSQQTFFVERRIARVGPSRICDDAEQLMRLHREAQLEPGFDEREASRWERIPVHDPRVGPALKELGGLYIEPLEHQLDIRMGGWIDSYEGLVISPNGDPIAMNSELPALQTTVLAPGLTWVSWSY